MKSIGCLIIIVALFLMSCQTEKKSEIKKELQNTLIDSISDTMTTHSDIVTTRTKKVKKERTDSWLVVLSGSKTYAEALRIKENYDFETEILNSSDYTGLNNGWFINCVLHATKESAQKQAEALKVNKINNYIKFSGTALSGIINNHFLVYENRYMLLDIEADATDIGYIIGYQKAGYGEFMARATYQQENMPENIKSVLNTEVVTYNSQGKSQIAKIIDVNIIAIPYLHWSEYDRYNSENESFKEEQEKTWDLIERSDETLLVAVLDIDEDFEARIAHPDAIKENYEFSITNPEKSVLSKVYETDIFKKNLALAEKQEAYIFEEQRKKGWVHVLTTYERNDHKYTYVNLIFGDPCSYGKFGDFYANIAILWDHTNATFEELQTFDHYNNEFGTTSFEYKFSPIFSQNNAPELIGYVTDNFKGMDVYFKKEDQWTLTRKLKFRVHHCD